jgi:DNA-directed RNA polymerase beta' subunit
VQIIRSERTETDWILRIRLLDAVSLMQGAPPGGDPIELERVALQEAHDQILKIAVKGMENVRKAVVQRERESVITEGGKVTVREFCSVLSQGVNLQRAFNTPGVNAARTSCNDIHEICAVLGIDAAARVLYDELVKVLFSNGTFVNPRHMQLLVDLMTHSGKLTAVSRHGMSQMSDSILQRACFEQAMDVLRGGAVKGAKDSLTCVTAALMMGTTPPVGTGRVHAIPTTHVAKPAAVLYKAAAEDVEMVVEQQQQTWSFTPGSPPATREWTFEPMSP